MVWDGPTVILQTSERPDLPENTFDESQQKMYDAIHDHPLVISTIPYFEPEGKSRVIAGCFYQPVRANVPKSLPPLFPLPSPAYEVRDSLGKGKGLFARRDIQRGEVIIIERPLIIIPLLLTDRHTFSPAEILDTLIGRLTEEEREILFSLSNSKGSDMSRVTGILSTNGIRLDLKGVPDAETHAAVYSIISRANHSCGPNTSWRFDYNTFSMCLQAATDIPASAELTAAYCPLSMNRDRRISELQRKYHFTCTCPHCAQPASESDYRRSALVAWPETQMTYAKWATSSSRRLDAVILSCIQALVLIKKEGMESDYAYRHYEDLAKSYGALGDKKKMREWGWKFLMVYKGDEARDEERLAAWVDWLRDPPRYFPDWGKAAVKKK